MALHVVRRQLEMAYLQEMTQNLWFGSYKISILTPITVFKSAVAQPQPALLKQSERGLATQLAEWTPPAMVSCAKTQAPTRPWSKSCGFWLLSGHGSKLLTPKNWMFVKMIYVNW